MPNRTAIQYFDGFWEIYQDGVCVTDYLRYYAIKHDNPLTKQECLDIIEKTKDVELILRKYLVE